MKNQYLILNVIEKHQKAKEYFVLGKFDLAIALCHQIIEVKPDFIPAYQTIGNALETQGNLEAALSWYTQALKIQPNLAELYKIIGNLYSRKKQWDEAIACYEKAIKLKPTLTDIYEKLGEIFQQRYLENLQAALSNYCLAIDYSPGDESNYHKLLEIQPYNPEICRQLANTLLSKNKLGSAIIFYQIALITEPENPEIHFNLGKILTKQGYLGQGIYEYKLALKVEKIIQIFIYNLA